MPANGTNGNKLKQMQSTVVEDPATTKKARNSIKMAQQKQGGACCDAGCIII